MISDVLLKVSSELMRKDNGFIVFAGAGIPKNCGVPTWKDLLKALLELVPEEERNIEDIDPKEYPDIAQRVYDLLCEQDREQEYHDTIKRMIKPTNTPESAEQIHIVITTNWIITTNFDDTFESAFQRKFEVAQIQKSINKQILPDFKTEDLSNQESIIYLHGKANEEFIIFKTSDYEKYYPTICGNPNGSTDVEEYLNYVFKYHTIVFLGFSFNDKYINNTLSHIYGKIKKSDEINLQKRGFEPRLERIRHYAFLKKVDFEDNDNLLKNFDTFHPESDEYKRASKLIHFRTLVEELMAINIQVVPCNEYIDWVDCFHKIREFRKEGELEYA
ncbi:hypothetical protein ES705_26809 [subsurface metagenome]